MIDVDQLRCAGYKRATSHPQFAFRGTVTDGTTGTVKMRPYVPLGQTSQRVIYFSHGGFGLFSDLDLQDAYCCRLATASHCQVIAMDYRLAPKDSFASAVEDVRRCVAAAAWHAQMLLCGDSAGGALSIATARDLGSKVEGVPLTSTNLDLALQSFDRTAPVGPDWETLVFAITAQTRPAALRDAPQLRRIGQHLPSIFIAAGAPDALVRGTSHLGR